ncbi:unannotated protein [freshwater metagenome]|uniref:Unannotated protein n=1 Tax=freshwater metagenome TaxID=449393 RepID=A0A6J6FD25_9ZZZZ|nr:hypothetical protein [Actinomycetota bacterium]
MANDEILDAVAEKVEPSRRKFVLGLLAAGITAPSVASFVMGKAKDSASRVSLPVRPSSIIDGSGNFNFQWMDPSGNTGSYSSANYMYETYLSGNFLRDASGNFLLDASGNLLCGTSGNILLDGSGNALLDPSGNYPYLPHPSGNWGYDISSNTIGISLRDASGNAFFQILDLDPSGNAFYDRAFNYDSNGIVDWYASPQIPGLACVVSANHIQVQQAPTTTAVPAPTTTVQPSGSNSSTTTTTPVTPVTVSGTIPTVR